MKNIFLLFISACLTMAAFGKEPPVSRDEAYRVLSPAEQSAGDTREKPEGLEGRVVTGYQGWFRAEGDGTGLGFHHYGLGGKFEPGHCSIDQTLLCLLVMWDWRKLLKKLVPKLKFLSSHLVFDVDNYSVCVL